MKKQYRPIAINRNGTPQSIGGVKNTKEEAYKEIKQHIQKTGYPITINGITISTKPLKKEQPYDILSYEIWTREVSEWVKIKYDRKG